MTTISTRLALPAVLFALATVCAAPAFAAEDAESAKPETILAPASPEYRQFGVVYGESSEGWFRCSGTSVQSPNESLVVTAGHCVHDEGHWAARKWVFIPGYRYGERPFGTFIAHWIGTTPGWLHHEDFNFDVGMAVVGRNERGETLQQAVGGAHFASGLSPSQAFDVYGYPVAQPFTGATLQRCSQAPFEGYDFEAFLNPGPLDLGVRCEVSGGSSGGGWVISGNRIDGVTSNTYPDDETTTYGPYFGGAVADLYARASGVR